MYSRPKIIAEKKLPTGNNNQPHTDTWISWLKMNAKLVPQPHHLLYKLFQILI